MNDSYSPDRTEDSDLVLLSRFREDVASLTAEDYAAARRHVMDSTDHPALGGLHKHRRVITPLRLSVAAGVVALALLAPGLVGRLGPDVEPSASAAELLNSAADNTIHSADATMQPGQWLHVNFEDEGLDGEQSYGQNTETWVPYDRTGDWYYYRPTFDSLTPYIVAERGAFYGKSWLGPNTNAKDPYAFLTDLPRETRALRTYVYESSTGGNSPDDAALDFIDELLRSGVVPADLRASLYRVVATIPGVEVSGEVTAPEGGTGVAFSRYQPDDGTGYTRQLIVDPETGLFLGTKLITDNSGLTYSSYFDYEVVDEVPTHVRYAAQRTNWKSD
jgi:hypothetical protein